MKEKENTKEEKVLLEKPCSSIDDVEIVRDHVDFILKEAIKVNKKMCEIIKTLNKVEKHL